MPYFNYRIETAATEWERRNFLQAWWRIYGGDRRWTPPPYRRLRRELNPARNAHLARLDPLFVHVEAFYRRAESDAHSPLAAGPINSLSERPLATTALLRDPRRRDGTAYLGLYHAANEEESTDHLLSYLVDQLLDAGCSRLVGPTGLSPYLGAGALQDRWDLYPPLHTPYNPPYLPELLEQSLRPFRRGRLYHAEATAPTAVAGPATLLPLAPGRLADDLLPLLAAASENRTGFAPPDAAEAAFLLRWWGVGLFGWLAAVDDEPVGFLLLQPDWGPQLRRAGGGRTLLWSLWLRLRRKAAVTAGRVLAGGVLPQWRRQGIGRQLWQQALHTAHEWGWAQLTVGPVWEGETAVAFLQSQDAAPVQRYALYEWSF